MGNGEGKSCGVKDDEKKPSELDCECVEDPMIGQSCTCSVKPDPHGEHEEKCPLCKEIKKEYSKDE